MNVPVSREVLNTMIANGDDLDGVTFTETCVLTRRCVKCKRRVGKLSDNIARSYHFEEHGPVCTDKRSCKLARMS